MPNTNDPEYQDPQITERQNSISFLKAIPGGATADAPERAVAIIVGGALLFLILVRKGFRPVLA